MSCFMKTHFSRIRWFVVGQIDSLLQESINRTCQINFKREKISNKLGKLGDATTLLKSPPGVFFWQWPPQLLAQYTHQWSFLDGSSFFFFWGEGSCFLWGRSGIVWIFCCTFYTCSTFSHLINRQTKSQSEAMSLMVLCKATCSKNSVTPRFCEPVNWVDWQIGTCHPPTGKKYATSENDVTRMIDCSLNWWYIYVNVQKVAFIALLSGNFSTFKMNVT